MKKIRVLIVDDSEIVRNTLSSGLAEDPEIEVVGTAEDPYDARDQIAKLNPEVLTLDVEMPRMTGVQFLRYLMPQFPMPVIVVSSITEKGKQVTMDALEAGAIDFVTKPSVEMDRGVDEMLQEILAKIKIAAKADVSFWKTGTCSKSTTAAPKASQVTVDETRLIAIGASTGGVEATRQLLQKLPMTSPGIVIAQHMPIGFTAAYASKLNEQCSLQVREAKTGDQVLPGCALIAPGGQQMQIEFSGKFYQIKCTPEENPAGHSPSIDVLFRSVAEHAKAKAIGIMLTGMGDDGVDAMQVMRQAGARTLAQDESSSAVFGMPYEAYKRGAAEKLMALDDIPAAIVELLKES
ncbi:MAG: chemotaxis response regulator protein-glutamate methylesterase [SAR324 cluster bacterium]|nr:chemotaxis response regulator protein-glutamate methylesterase [SAR324 cluster bacterium]